MPHYRAVVAGAGKIADIHLRTMMENDKTVLAAIADTDGQKAAAAAAKYGIRPYADFRHMVVQERPDLVVIALPHHLHKEAAIWCLEQGCHVLLEKPMALNARECAEINEAARRAGVVLAVGHMQHYSAEFVKAKAIIGSGSLGQLTAIHSRRYGFYFDEQRPAWFLDKARSGGGVVINIGSHVIDRIQWLTDSRIVSVKAELTFGGARGDVEGGASLLLRTAQAVAATVSICGYPVPVKDEMELLFTGGSLKIEPSKGLWLGGARGYEPVELEQQPGPFSAQWSAVLNAVEHGEAVSISGAYSQTVAEVVDAAYRSHETRAEREVERLPLAVARSVGSE